MGGRGRGRAQGGGSSSMEINSEKNTHTPANMAGDVANSKRDSASRAQQQWGKEMLNVTLVGDNIALSSRNGDTKNKTSQDEVADRVDDGPIYRLLDGDADTDYDVGISCEESLALLAHEMRCCSESGTDSETETIEEGHRLKEELEEKAEDLEKKHN